MTSPIRTAVLAIAAAFAIAVPARAEAPAVVAQVEIRGLDAFFGAVDRIAAPYAPAGEAKGMLTGMGTASVGVNPFELIDGAGTVRVVVYGVDDDMDALLDFPAAGGDVAGVLGKLQEALPAAEVPEDVVLPEGALSLSNGSFASTICIPRGERIALVPHSAFAHEIRDVDGVLALFDAAPTVPAEGVLALAIDFGEVLKCASAARADSPAAKLRDFLSSSDFPVRAIALGLGLDGADRFRSDVSVTLVPGTPHARLVETIGAPASPLANAILFPDAVAAASCRQVTSIFTDDELRDFFVRQFDSNLFAASLTVGDDESPIPDGVRDAMFSAYAAVFRLIGDEYAAVLLPSEEGDATGNAGILAFPENPQETLDGLPGRVNGAVAGLVEAIRAATDDEDDGNLFRIELSGERMVQNTSVRSYLLRIDDAEEDTTRTIGSFDAAALGPALYIGTLSEDRLSEVLADLSAGETAKGPVSTMPAFAEAFGEMPADASCGYIRLGTVLRAVLSRLEALAGAAGEDGIDFGGFIADSDIPDVTLATAQRWIPAGGRLDTTVSMPLADLHAAVDAIAKAAIAVRSAIPDCQP